MQCVDHCWLPVWWPAPIGLTHNGREGGRWECLGGDIYKFVTPVQPGKHGDIPELLLWLLVDTNNKSLLG